MFAKFDQALGKTTPTPTNGQPPVTSRADEIRALGKTSAPATAPATPGILSRMSSDVSQAGANVSNAINDTSKNPIEAGVNAASAAASAIPKVASEVLPQGVRDTIGAVGTGASNIVNWLGDKLGSTQIAQDFVTNHPDAAKALESAANIGAGAGNIAGTILGAKGVASAGDAVVPVAAKVGKAGVKVAQEVTPKIINKTVQVAGKVKQAVAPTLTPEEATGQVIQGKTGDVAAAHRTLSSLDTKGVKTYADLTSKLQSEIKPLAQKVDAELMKDPTAKPLSSFTQKVGYQKINYVQEAINHLKELYKGTSDIKGINTIQNLEAKAIKDGLTNKEVNDISRTYGNEFGTKAFSKVNGDPLTSVNAQKFENIRSGLKDTARKGLGGDEAKLLDAKLSDLYDTKALIDKQTERVNASTQKTSKVGVVPKIVSGAVKTADVLTGSPLKAIGHAMGNTGATNALSHAEIEANLAKNLKTIKGK